MLEAAELFKQVKQLGSSCSLRAEMLSLKPNPYDTQECLTSQSTFKQLEDRFKLFVDENGIWRCGGRLVNYYSTFLPRDHPFASLVIVDTFACVGCNGAKDSLTEVHSKFWIPNGRSLVYSSFCCLQEKQRNAIC